MLKSITINNFKALRDIALSLNPFTLLVGPNGSGKSTLMQAITGMSNPGHWDHERFTSYGVESRKTAVVQVMVEWADKGPRVTSRSGLNPSAFGPEHYANGGRIVDHNWISMLNQRIKQMCLFRLDPATIAADCQTEPNPVLRETGHMLASVLTGLRDESDERFEDLKAEFCRWFPDYDSVGTYTVSGNVRRIRVRSRVGQHWIEASVLSSGTLVALALLTLAYLPTPPSLICLDDMDQHLHPRLLRDAKEALYRLAYPEAAGESRPPVQVIATTHSPYLLDLFKDHPEEIVIASKQGLEVKFERLSDHPHIDEILQDAPLGEIWYSGILGGVPVEP